MEAAHLYILIAIITLAVLIVAVLFIHPTSFKKNMTPLLGIAWGLIIAGIIFGEGRVIGYSLIGAGVLLSVIDVILKFKKHKIK